MSGGFQQQVYNQPAQGVAGDFASTNPYFTYDAGPGGLVAGVGGVQVGAFAWAYPPADPNSAPTTVLNSGAGPVSGFIGRALQGLNTTYLLDASMMIPVGFMVTLFTGGCFWVVNNGTTTSALGNKTYANFANGLASFAPTGTPNTGATSTASTITPETASATGSITGDVMTITAVGSGTIYPGATVTGTGGVTTCQVISQISGTPGGVGTYYVSIPLQTAASQTLSFTYGLLTVGGTVTGSFGVGDTLSGTGVVAGSALTQLISGTGGSGSTLVVNNNTLVASGTIDALGNVETKWVAMSVGAPGQLVKIDSHPLG
jgi:hypothetical protein